MARPYCDAKIWNYPTRYTELGCNTARGYFLVDPNPDVSGSGPANAPSEPSQPGQDQGDTNSSGQDIDGNQNTQISGSNNTIYYGGGGGGGDGSGDDAPDGAASRLDPYNALASAVLLLFVEWML